MIKKIAISLFVTTTMIMTSGCAGLGGVNMANEMKEVNMQLGLVVSAKDVKVAADNSVLNGTLGAGAGAMIGSLFGGGNTAKAVSTVGGGALGGATAFMLSKEDGQELTVALDDQKGKVIKVYYPIKDGIKFQKNDYVILTTDAKSGKLIEITEEKNRYAAMKKIANKQSVSSATPDSSLSGAIKDGARFDKNGNKIKPSVAYPDPLRYNPTWPSLSRK